MEKISFCLESGNTTEQDLEDMKKGNAGDLEKASSGEVEVLRERIKQLENSETEWRANVSTHLQTESALKCRIKELHLSEKNLLEEIKQLRMTLCHMESTIERVKSRVQNLQEQFTELVQQQERAEAKHKGKLQQLQNCLRIKEDEVKRQSEYFEHCKQNQKRQIAMLRKQEACLQSHTGRLEKEVRDLKAALSVLSGELQEETWQHLQGEMEAAFSRAVGSWPPSSRMGVAELKLLLEEAQRHIGSYLVVLKHQLKSLLGKGGNSEMETPANEFEDGRGEGFSTNQKSCSLACELKPSENALLRMKWGEAIEPAGSPGGQAPHPLQCAKESCVLATDTSRWHFRKEEFPDGFLMKYLKCNSGPWVAVSEELSPADTEKVGDNADVAAALGNICLLFGCAPVKARHGRGMKWLRGHVLKHAAANSFWKPVALSAVTLPEYRSQEVSEARSSPQTNLPFPPNSISEADGGSILGKDSEAKKVKMTECATLKLPDDKPKICIPKKEKVGWVNGRGGRSLAEKGRCVKDELGNTLVKSENKTGKDQKAKFPVNHGISAEVSQVLDEMIHRRTAEQAVESTCCAGRKGEGCKPLSNAGRKEVPPKPVELQTEQEGARGGTFDDDAGRSPGKMTISNGKEKQLKTELLEQASLCRQRSETQKEKREREREGSTHGIEEQNSNPVLTAQREMAEPECLKGDTCPLDLVKHDKNECLIKGLSQMQTVGIYSHKISSLMQENCWQLCLLQDKNHKSSLKIRALEEEIDMYSQYLLAVDETHVTPYQKCFSADKGCSEEFLKKEMVGDHQGAPGTFWGKGRKSLPEKSFPSAAKQWEGRLGKQTSPSESKKAMSLEERKVRNFQLLSCLKDERNNLLEEVTQLVQDEEKCLEQICKLEEEGERNLQRIGLLERDKESLLRKLCEAKGEHQRCAVLISELDEYKNTWFQGMLELEEEKYVLKNSVETTQKETCSKCFESQNMIDHLKLEHEKLVKVMVARGIDSEDQAPTGVPVAERGAPGMKQGNEIRQQDSETETETRTLKEQLEKANKELKIQQEKLDKAKKDAQKWYVELGFAETRYEEVSLQLKDALSELQQFKEAEADPPRQIPRSSVNEPQELVEEESVTQRLEQQVLTCKAQLRDHGVLHHQNEALKKEMELLRTQIKEKNEELQRRQSEAKLAAALFKPVPPPFSPASDPDACRCAGANGAAGPAAASVFPEAGGSCSARSPSIKGTASLLKLTSPEKVIDFHRELSKKHCSDYQTLLSLLLQKAPLNQETASCLFPSCQNPWDVSSVESKRRRVVGLSDPAHFSLMETQEQLFVHSDASQNQMRNLHTGTFDQGMKLKNVPMNNTWISEEKPGGSASVAAAKCHLSDIVSSSDKCLSPLGEKKAASKRGNPMEITQGAPASVVSVHIIKTIGKSTLMVGWERPVLDELGCSNGTFITGYKVYVDGRCHKSVTSSACTKTVLENLDLSAPFEVSVQSVGASGLVSGKKHIQYHCCRTKKEASETPLSLGQTEAAEADQEERMSTVRKQPVASSTAAPLLGEGTPEP